MSNVPMAKRMNRAICVYCGAANGTDPAFVGAARALGKAIAKNGIDLVYGGGSVGLMGEVARAAMADGGFVVGVIPEFLKAREVHLATLPELIVTADMHERKRIMFERADAFVALPGGIGTLEELIEQLSWVQLGRHRKPVVIADIAGFWRPLLALAEHMQVNGFLKKPHIEGAGELLYHVVERTEDIVPCIAGLWPERDATLEADIVRKF